ncbi:MAG: hypothetical protein RLY21_1582 [Planctomycetota bacterium]
MVLYPSSASPRTSATSIDRIAISSSSGTPSSSASRTLLRADSRSRMNASETGVSAIGLETKRTSEGDSTVSEPTTPRLAANCLIRESPGIRATSMCRTVPTNAMRSATPHGGGASSTATDNSAEGSPISRRAPASSMNTTSDTKPTNRLGRTRYLARRSTAKPRSANGAETVASIRTRHPSFGTARRGLRAAVTDSSKRSPTPSAIAHPLTRSAPITLLALEARCVRSLQTAIVLAPTAHPAEITRHAATSVSAQIAHSTPDHGEPPARAQPIQSEHAKMQVVHGTTPRRSTVPLVAPSLSPGMGSPGP